MSALRDRLIKKSKLKRISTLSDSFKNQKFDVAPTPIKLFNIALSGSVNGGLPGGITMLAGESRSFKSIIALIFVKSWMTKNPDGVVLYYENEGGTPQAYWDMLGIDMDRVIKAEITYIEQLRNDIVNQIDVESGEMKDGEKVMIMVDSIGMIASRKELEDSREGNEVEDMTRAKKLASMYRCIMPSIKQRDIPCVIINHVYKTQEKYAKDVVTGGNKNVYSPDAIWIIKKYLDKDKKEVVGNEFVINIEKSRAIKEKSKFPFKVMFNGGVHPYSGLFDTAYYEMGYITMPSNGWYSSPATGDTKFRRADIEFDSDFWKAVFAHPTFQEALDRTYKLGSTHLIAEEDSAHEVELEDDE